MRHLVSRGFELHIRTAKISAYPSYSLRVAPDLARVYPPLVYCRSSQSSAASSRRGISQHYVLYQKSTSPYLVLLALVASTALAVDYLTFDRTENVDTPKEQKTESTPKSDSDSDSESHAEDSLSAFFAAMPVSQGFLGNLTPEQEQKLRDFWVLVLKSFGVNDPIADTNVGSARPITPADAPIHPVEDASSKKKERHGLFHRKHKDTLGSDSPGSPGKQDPEDKYGQTKELQEILANTKPEVLREAFWSMVKKDHPDALMLRFLRARKWDTQRALAMLVSTMHWRKNEVHVDDDIMIQGEGGALRDSQSNDANVKREGTDFLAQLRLGKSFMHGIDKEGRPICLVRVRLHRSGEQTERSLERYTVYVIETARLALQPPVETAVSLRHFVPCSQRSLRC